MKYLNKFNNYLSLVKFSHTIFALPFAIAGFSMAIGFTESHFSFKLLLLIIGCMVTARNAAMAFNRYIDRDIDVQNPRTAIREIPRGIVKPHSALTFVIINSLIFITLTWFINKLTFYLSPVALFVILSYSLTKRYTALCHFILGLGLALAPLGAWLAVTGTFHWLPVLVSLTVLCWTAGFDIIYALQDDEFDRSRDLHSIPAYMGRTNALRLSSLLHLLSAGTLVLAGSLYPFSHYFWIGVAVFVGLLIYQHLIVKPNDLRRVNLAFFTTNGIASLIFAIFVILDIIIR